MIQFVSDLSQVGGFLRFHPHDLHDITEILLKVALCTIAPITASLSNPIKVLSVREERKNLRQMEHIQEVIASLELFRIITHKIKI